MSIDVTKPLELADGTPVEYVGAGNVPDSIRVTDPKGTRSRLGYGSTPDRWLVFNSDGTHYFKRLPDLRNVAEEKTMPNNKPLDLTKPMETCRGKAVRYFGERKAVNGRTQVFTYEDNGTELIITRFRNGRLFANKVSDDDIVNKVVREVRYLNLSTDETLKQDNKMGGLVQAIARTVDRPYAREYCTLKLTFEDGVLVSSEVVR